PLEGVECAGDGRDGRPVLRHDTIGGPHRIARSAYRAGKPLADLASIAMLFGLDPRHERAHALCGRIGKQRIERVAGRVPVLRLDSCCCDCDGTFDGMRPERCELFDVVEAIARTVADACVSVSSCNVRMGRALPGALE